MEGKLARFYQDEEPDDQGRFLDDILAWDDAKLEFTHDYNQWLFPLMEPSKANPKAPVLDTKQIAEFRSSPRLLDRVREAFDRLCEFYGLEVWEERGVNAAVRKAANFEDRRKDWLTPHNHNYLRVTRIITSLRLLGLDILAQAFYICMKEIHAENPRIIGAKSLEFWTKAAECELEV